MQTSGQGLKRDLKERHIQLIAIGGAIGVGLFLGSSVAIRTAGPALMLSYLVGGLAILVVMRALGELAVADPVSGSFGTYAYKFLGPLAGYITGWTYWFMWIVTCMAEITAAGRCITYTPSGGAAGAVPPYPTFRRASRAATPRKTPHGRAVESKRQGTGSRRQRQAVWQAGQRNHGCSARRC